MADEFAGLQKAVDDLKAFEEKNGVECISYSPLCKECLKQDKYMPGCFHEAEQAWVCCTKRKRPEDRGCGAIILTVKEYQEKRGKQGGTMYRARP